jgi:hypothetical protein
MFYYDPNKPAPEPCEVCSFRDKHLCEYCGNYPNWRSWPKEQWDAHFAKRAATYSDSSQRALDAIEARERERLDPTHNWPGRTLEQLRDHGDR